jgi:polysaccharide biosynthesis transport protein
MTQLPPHSHARMLPGTTQAPMRPIEYAAEPGDTMSFRQALTVVRRRALLILFMTAIGAGIGLFLAWNTPAEYTASAMLRMAGERQTLTGDEDQDKQLARTADPLLSLIQLIRSRTVAAAVVDTLGLQLYSKSEDFSVGDLDHIKVDPRAAGDSVMLTFAEHDVNARRGDRAVTARYGQPINLGIVQFTVTARPKVETAVLGLSDRETAITNLVNSLGATRREETDVLDVSYVSIDPRVAQRIVNASVQAFQSLSVQWARERSRRRSEFLAEQLAQTDSMLARAQADLSNFRSRQQLASSESKLTATQTAILQLDAQVAQLQADRETFGSLQQQLKSSDSTTREQALRALATSPAIAENPSVGGLYNTEIKYQQRIDSMTTGPWKTSEKNPDLVQLRGLARSNRSQLVDAVGSQIQTIDARIRSLKGLRDRTGASIQVLPAMAEEEMRLDRRVSALANMGDELRKDFQKARMDEAVEAGDVDVVALAPLPTDPGVTGSALRIGLGVVLGLMLGLILAYILEALNTSIRRPEDLEAVLHVPGLAVIPRITAGSRGAQGHFRRMLGAGKGGQEVGSPMAGNQTFSIGIEAFRNLRTSLTWSDGGEALKTLVVTSAVPGEGKTLTAANLAVTLAYDGLKVLLIDCDIRRPRVHGLFRLPRAPGLMELLTASANPGAPAPRAIRETSVARLSVLPCGALPMNAANLLSSTRMRVLLQELQEQYDIIVLDTPPVLATADAGIVASLTDGVLLVVRAGATDRNAAQRAYQQLANVGGRVVGTVLNDPGGEVAKEGYYYYPYDYAAEEQ